MKKLLFPTLLASLAITANAQNAPQRNEGIIQKSTATWCGPCGQWGWDLQEEIITSMTPAAQAPPQAFVLSEYGAESGVMNCAAADSLTIWGQSYPNWAFNNVNRTAFSSSGGIYTSTTKNTLINAADSFSTAAVFASTGFTSSITGSTLTVQTNTKFWLGSSGNYSTAVYVVEDGVMSTQNGQTGTVAHHNVLRSHLGSNVFGQPAGTATNAAGSEFAQTFTMTIPSGWNKNNLKILTVIWKQENGEMKFVNANSEPSAASSAISTLSDVQDFSVFPNPAQGEVHIAATLPAGTGTVSVGLFNVLGQEVASTVVTPQGNKLAATMQTSSMPAGTYLLKIYGSGVQATATVTLAH